MAEMTKEAFVEEIKLEKARYLEALGAYFDALIEHDFNKATKMASECICILKPEVQAYLVKQMCEAEGYEELEETYFGLSDAIDEIVDIGD